MRAIFFFVGFIMAIGLTGCMANLQPKLVKKEGITAENVQKGKALLKQSWEAQGLDRLTQHKTYSYDVTDTWKGLIGTITKPWPEKSIDAKMKYEIGTFNGQITFLSGKYNGKVAALQSWKYYEVKEEETVFFDQPDKHIAFELPTFQYFMELPDRLRNAPIISYGGTKEFEGQTYELVFATWHKAKGKSS